MLYLMWFILGAGAMFAVLALRGRSRALEELADLTEERMDNERALLARWAEGNRLAQERNETLMEMLAEMRRGRE
jgi:hypothetical protein